MPIPTFTRLGPNPEFSDVVNKVNTIVAELQNLMLGIDSVNAFEFGGWRVASDQLASSDGDVGFSTEDTAGDDIRIWAGDAKTGSPKFTVTKSGILTAVDGVFAGEITAESGTIGGFTISLTKLSGAGIIEGGTIRTSASGARIELSNNSLKTYNSSNQLQGLAWGTDVSGSTYGDAFFYDAGNKMAEFYNNVTDGLTIRPASGYKLSLGTSSMDTYGRGIWTFFDTVNLPTNTTIGNVSSTEIGYVDGVTSNIQTQLNGKASSFSGYSGSVSVITSVDFGGSTTTSSSLNFSNGILTSVT